MEHHQQLLSAYQQIHTLSEQIDHPGAGWPVGCAD